MLKTTLIHPQILNALGRSGHGSGVLISDGNYPHASGSPPNADIVYLNLKPGTLSVCEVLEAVVSVIPVESAMIMETYDKQDQPILKDFIRLLPDGTPIEKLERFDFYERAKDNSTTLVIATGEQRRFANILLTIGVVRAGEET